MFDFPFAWVLKKSNIPGNVIHDADNGLFVRPLFPGFPAVGATELESTVAGTSTVSGTLSTLTLLTGTPSGVATVTGTLTNLALRELAGTPSGTSAVVGTLGVVRNLTGTSSGVASVVGALDPILNGAVAGTATVSGTLSNIFQGDVGFEIPYLLGLGGKHVVELVSRPYGKATVAGVLTKTFSISGSSAGVGTVSGTLFTNAGTGFLAGTSAGVATVAGNLQNFDGTNIELAGTINGTSTVTAGAFEHYARQQPRFLYLYLNVGVGFDDQDDPSARADFVAFTGPDGQNNPSLLGQYLHQYINVGVGFTYDDPSARADFVAFTEPDGNNRDDFARYLYQYLRVIRGRKGYGRLAILPGYVDGNEFVPRPKPPSNEL